VADGGKAKEKKKVGANNKVFIFLERTPHFAKCLNDKKPSWNLSEP
jgi:hypothetical protein